MAIIRSEDWEVSMGKDTGGAINALVVATPLGIFQEASLPDPELGLEPFYGMHANNTRNPSLIFRTQVGLEGSIPNVWMLDGRLLGFGIGQTLTTGVGPYTHTITTTRALVELAIHATYFGLGTVPDVQLMRRWNGGKVGRMSLHASEGEQLRVSFDQIVFRNLAHNQSSFQKYNASLARPSITFPSDEPYYFNQGALTFFGTAFARLREIRIEIDNAIDPKYYIQDNAAAGRLPSSILEGKRVIRLRGNLDIEDFSLFTRMMDDAFVIARRPGFQTILTFTRGAGDTITITMPPAAPNTGLDQQGCFFTRTPHNITNESLVAVPFEAQARSMQVVVVDSIAAYPSQ